MTLQTSGPISLADIQTEFGGTNPISLSEYYAGGSYVPSDIHGTDGFIPTSGAIDINKFYGTKDSTTNSFFITTSTNNYVVRSTNNNIMRSALYRTPSSFQWNSRSADERYYFNTISTTGSWFSTLIANSDGTINTSKSVISGNSATASTALYPQADYSRATGYIYTVHWDNLNYGIIKNYLETSPIKSLIINNKIANGNNNNPMINLYVFFFFISLNDWMLRLTSSQQAPLRWYSNLLPTSSMLNAISTSLK
jgi:hypothetical protein